MAANLAAASPVKGNYSWQSTDNLRRASVLKSNFKPLAPAPTLSTQNNLLLALPNKIVEQLQPELKTVFFEAGQTVYDIGDAFDFVYFPNNFVASRLAITEDGAMIEVGVIGHEGMLGLSALLGVGSARNMTVAETSGSALRLRVKTLQTVFRENFELQTLLLGYYNNFVAQISQRAACRSRHSVAQQLCTWLLQVHNRTDSSDLCLTQETMANRLGSRRASVTVAVGDLERANLVRCKRGHIIICDRYGLENQACECYQLLESQFENCYNPLEI